MILYIKQTNKDMVPRRDPTLVRRLDPSLLGRKFIHPNEVRRCNFVALVPTSKAKLLYLIAGLGPI
jgi:hypothetical protein